MIKMTGRFRGLLTGLLLLCPAPAFAGETPPAVPAGSAALASDLDAAIDGALAQKRLVGVVVLVPMTGMLCTTGRPGLPTARPERPYAKIRSSVWPR